MNVMEKIKKAVEELRRGNFVLVHDSEGRENETDFVMAAEFITPTHIAKMRQDAGGLICLSVDEKIAEQLYLPFIADVQNFSKEKFPLLRHTQADDIPYDEKSSFSITINHRKTFTGISDEDRALTIREFGKFCKNLPKENLMEKFGKEFRSPGHVPLLISSGIRRREGHTELSTTLLKIANLTPIATICEMLDSQLYKSLSREKAISYAEKNHKVFLEGSEIKLYFKEQCKEQWRKLE
jgi:3,4-dihydroxy 2-butanone 4-phosphate synthase